MKRHRAGIIAAHDRARHHRGCADDKGQAKCNKKSLFRVPTHNKKQDTPTSICLSIYRATTKLQKTAVYDPKNHTPIF